MRFQMSQLTLPYHKVVLGTHVALEIALEWLYLHARVFSERGARTYLASYGGVR